jgi:SulP family sulfate permease
MDTTDSKTEQPEIEQPGLSRLREAVANAARRQLPGRATLLADGVAGLNSTLGSAPDGMANSILAGVNPVYGLYACMVGPLVGGLFSSTQLMIISSTSAAALAANQGLTGLAGAERDRALFLLVILVGVFQILFGLLRVGQLIRFVSYSVMTGFLTGVAGLMILSQFPTVTGVEATGGNKLIQAFSVLLNLEQLDPLTGIIALLTLLLIVLLARTPLGNLAPLAAIIVPSVLVGLLGWNGVQTVQDVGEIPQGFPAFFWPSLADLSPAMLTSALAVALIVIVQGAGVSQSVPNPDGARRRASRDILAQGAANVAVGFFRGVPVGGSLSSTALSVVAGPKTRWAAIFAGLWMAAVVLLFPGLIAYVAMPALGALLIHAGVNTIKPSDWQSIWEMGWSSRLAALSTLLATLTLPIQAAVGIGVVLSAMLYLNRSSTDLTVVELVKREDGAIEERKRPKRLKSNGVTVLDVYGPLFYASAPALGRLLPALHDAQNPVVILRMRGQTELGVTLMDVLSTYAEKLKSVNGRLYLTGLSAAVIEQLRHAGKLSLTEPVRLFEATAVRGESTQAAVVAAQKWLVGQNAATTSDHAAGQETADKGEA